MTSLRERLNEDLKQAMRDREVDLRDTLRYVISAVKNVEIDRRAELTADEEMAVLRTQVKQRQDSIEQFVGGDRADLADRERMQLAILERYLPQQMTDQELDEFVQQGILELGASGPKDMGKVMGLLNKQAEGRVDGRRLSATVKTALSN